MSVRAREVYRRPKSSSAHWEAVLGYVAESTRAVVVKELLLSVLSGETRGSGSAF